MNFRMLSQTALLCAAGSLIALPAAGLAMSSDAPPAITMLEKETVTGTIVNVDLSNNQFTLKTSDGNMLKIAVTKDTQYTLNGEEVTATQALKQGATASVHHEEKKASRVDSSIES